MATNTVPRIYIAATRQNDGKTTASIGLMAVLGKQFERLGFIKPVGQRYVEVDGHRIDADAVLMRDVYGCANALKDMSPIAVDRTFTRRYIDNPNPRELEQEIIESFDRVAGSSDAVVVEGTGHAGVGSIFDLNNARVAAMLEAPAVIVSCGGIGRPFDEITLNRAVFEKHGVKIAGVIANKVDSDKLDVVSSYLSQALERVGLPLLGVIPRRAPLLHPTIRHVRDALDGELLNGERRIDSPVHNIIIGAMSPHQALHYFSGDCLVVTPGDRDDLVLTAVSLTLTMPNSADHSIAGIVLTGGVRPRRSVLRVIQRTQIPVVLATSDTYSVASTLHDMMVKIKPNEKSKIQLIQQIYRKHFNVERLMEQLT
jgi:BioD-like phosphotransacetylase family protein